MADRSGKHVADGGGAEDLLSRLRNRVNPQVVVTVDRMATGTDRKPLKSAMFMRAVKRRDFFEQREGRGVRVIGAGDGATLAKLAGGTSVVELAHGSVEALEPDVQMDRACEVAGLEAGATPPTDVLKKVTTDLPREMLSA